MKIKFSDVIQVAINVSWVILVISSCSYAIMEMIESNNKILQALSIFVLPLAVFLVYLGHWHDAGRVDK